MVEAFGSPIGGENPPHDRRWRAAVTAAASTYESTAAVALHFRLEPHRRVDLDNLVRPALAGLRDASVLARSFKGLDAIWTTKAVTDAPGVVIELRDPGEIRQVPQPGTALATSRTRLFPAKVTATARLPGANAFAEPRRCERRRRGVAGHRRSEPALTGRLA
jgi:hypothetical protein